MKRRVLPVFFALVALWVFLAARPPFLLAAENLLGNPGFESAAGGVPDSWSFYPSTAAFEATASAAKSGVFAASLTKKTSKSYAYLYQEIEVSPSAAYTFSGWVLHPRVPAVKNIKLRVDWQDADGKRVELAEAAAEDKSGWQKLTLTLSAPLLAKTARVEGYIYLNEANPSHPALFDDFEFAKVDDESGAAEAAGAEAEEEKFRGTIAQIKKLSLGSKVEVEGTVTVEPAIFGDDVFYIRDETGGIKVRYADSLKNQVLGKVGLGMRVKVACTVEEAWSEKYIKADAGSTVEVLGGSTNIPDPVKASTGEVGEELEGQLVWLSGEVVETSGSTFYLDDGSGRAKIYVKESTLIEVPRKSVGDYAEIVGIVSQWGNLEDGSPNYRVMPRYDIDVSINPDISDNSQDDDGYVLSSVTELPRTGANPVFGAIGLVMIALGLVLKKFLQRESNCQRGNVGNVEENQSDSLAPGESAAGADKYGKDGNR